MTRRGAEALAGAGAGVDSPAMWLVLQAARSVPGGYGAALVQSLLALAAVSILAWVVLRWSARAGLGRGGKHLEVLERLALDHRRGLVLVRAGRRRLLLGIGEGAAPRLVAELDASELPEGPAPKTSFLDILRTQREAPASTAAPPSPAEPEHDA